MCNNNSSLSVGIFYKWQWMDEGAAELLEGHGLVHDYHLVCGKISWWKVYRKKWLYYDIV